MLTFWLILALSAVVYLIMGIGTAKLSAKMLNSDVSFDDFCFIVMFWPLRIVVESFS